MANLSDWTGKIRFEKREDCNVSIETLQEIAKITERWDFGSINIPLEELKFNEDIDTYIIGRWSLYSTGETYWEGSPTLEKFLSENNCKGLTIIFDGVDYEPGCEVFEKIYLENVYLGEDNPNNITKCDIEELDLTSKNLVKYHVYDEAIDTECDLEEIKEYFIEEQYFKLFDMPETTNSVKEILNKIDFTDMIEEKEYVLSCISEYIYDYVEENK